MTPNQKRKLKHEAWALVAGIPRKSYLGKYKRLTEIQTLWIKSLLRAWGDMYGGRIDGKLRCSGGSGVWWQLVAEEWDDDNASQIIKVMGELRKNGYRGEAQLERAKAILWPKQSLGAMLVAADRKEEGDFMERAVLTAMEHLNPAYIIGKSFYAGHHTVTELGETLRNHYAPWLSRIQSEDQVRWCLEVFNSAVFCSVRVAICIKNSKNMEKSLQTDNETL